MTGKYEGKDGQAWSCQDDERGFRPFSMPSSRRFSHAQPLTGSDFEAWSERGDGSSAVRTKSRKGPRIALVVFGILFALIVGGGLAIAMWVSSLDASLGFEDEAELGRLEETLVPEPAAETEASAFYMLLLGSDARGGEASRSDVTMLVRIDPESTAVDLVSIPRDTMVTLGGSTQKINAAYSYGGAAGAVAAVSEFAGVPISHYAEIHFEELERLVDMLGGVWVNVPEGFENASIGVSVSAGEQCLTGEEALVFARERYNVSGGDFSRAQAQRIIVEAIIKQVLSLPPAELPGVIGNLANCVTTDYSVGDIVALAQRFVGKDLTVYSSVCPSYSLSEGGVSYVCPMFDEWRDMMCRVDAGLDPNGVDAIPQAQLENGKLGSASNSPAPHEYESLAANAGLTTDDVVRPQ